MPWSMIGNYSDKIPMGKLFESIQDGNVGPGVGSGWIFPSKYNSSKYTVEASIGEFKTDNQGSTLTLVCVQFSL